MSLVTQVSDLATRVGTEFKTVRAEVSAATGSLAALATTDKSNLVAAINEVFAAGPGTITADDITDATTLGKALIRAVDAAAARGALSVYSTAEADAAMAATAAAVVDAAPGALDTLRELATALGDNPNFAAQVATDLGNRLRVDAAQTLTGTQQTQGQDNLNVYSRAQIGDPATDFVSIFENALTA